jgi:hypothetical protein
MSVRKAMGFGLSNVLRLGQPRSGTPPLYWANRAGFDNRPPTWFLYPRCSLNPASFLEPDAGDPKSSKQFGDGAQEFR